MNQSLTDRLDALGSQHMSTMLEMIQQTLIRTVGADSSLVSMTAYHMRTGGKRLRALLPLIVAQAMGHEPEQLLAFGAACELLHNATLVHDDLQDGDRLRRGEPTIWVHYGPAQAINLGDAMLYATLALVDDLQVDVARRHAVTARIVRETLRVVDGQEREFLLQNQASPTMEGYFKMVEGKTSGLFALPVSGSAELCGAEPELLEVLQESTRHLGVVFQIQDDLLDLYGHKGRDRVGTDIAEGKISMPVAYTLVHGATEDAKALRALLLKAREEVSDEEIRWAIRLFEASGAIAFAWAEIDRRVALSQHVHGLEAHPVFLTLIKELAKVFLAPIEQIRHRVQ